MPRVRVVGKPKLILSSDTSDATEALNTGPIGSTLGSNACHTDSCTRSTTWKLEPGKDDARNIAFAFAFPVPILDPDSSSSDADENRTQQPGSV